MNERERAESLARAIDEMLQGAKTLEPDSSDEELRSLIRVANARREASIEAGRRSSDHESAVWQRLVTRLEDDSGSRDSEADGHAADDMRDIVAARLRQSEDVFQLAEQHRDEIWRRVQQRISKQVPKSAGIHSILQSRTLGDAPAVPSGPGDAGPMLTGVSEADSMLRIALSNPSAQVAGKHETGGSQSRLRARMRSDPGRLYPLISRPSTGPGFWLRAGAVAVVVALGVAVGPIPFTGVYNSPASEAIRFGGRALGVTD